MEYQMERNRKLCGTCEYWVGPRQPNMYGTSVILPDQSIIGKCWCLNGPHARGERYSNYTTCFCYKKWSVLKD